MDLPRVETRFYDLPEPLPLKHGGVLPGVRLAYEQYGILNADKSNAILLFHALTGSQHAYGYNPKVPGTGSLWKEENYIGWWDAQIGSGKSLDTEKFCIICVNLIGSCYGSTGPTSINAATGKPWAGLFPRISATDQAHAQAQLLDQLGIERLHAVVAPSIGGLVGLTFLSLYPARVARFVSIGSGYKNTMRNKLMVFEQILCIENDSKFKNGFYSAEDPPINGLALARIISHKLFVCWDALESRARKEVCSGGDMLTWYMPQQSSESYMLHQGTKFAKRFDANAYLRIADLWANYHAASEAGYENMEDLLEDLRPYDIKWLIFAIDSDLCFKQKEQVEFVALLAGAGMDCELVTVHSEKGHDSFLLEPELYDPSLMPFLKS